MLIQPNNPFLDVAENMLDHLEDCKRTFPTDLALGGSLEAIRCLLRGRGCIQKLIMIDPSSMEDNSLNNVISYLGLHWTNDLPGVMIQCRLALKPHGLFLAAILGGETLKDLRIACTIAQIECEGCISPQVSTLSQVRDAGDLLTRVGFSLPGVDVNEYTVRYDTIAELIEHLPAMGETNALF